ncbi:hypothetical protein [Providencia alcalifaciens]|uniref:hypothetical protein n=1 Tax=Providencia alcalifaciens TaxID=126385 RepID=UPI003D29000F
MEMERFANLDKKLDLVRVKIKRSKELLAELNDRANAVIENMTSVSEKLLISGRHDVNKMQQTMDAVKNKINNSLSEQVNKVSLSHNTLLEQESILTDLKKNNVFYSQNEIDFYIKQVQQDLKNNESWNQPKNNFEKIDFTNHGGLRGMIFTPIANFNKKNDELAKALYEIDVLVKEINEERLNIELDALKAMKDPVKLDMQPALLGMLAEQQSGFEPTNEGYFSTENPINSMEASIPFCDCGGIGRTAMCA